MLQKAAPRTDGGKTAAQILPIFQNQRFCKPARDARKAVGIPLVGKRLFRRHEKTVFVFELRIGVLRKTDDGVTFREIFRFRRGKRVVIKGLRIAFHLEHGAREHAYFTRALALVLHRDPPNLVRVTFRNRVTHFRFDAAFFGRDARIVHRVLAAVSAHPFRRRVAPRVPIPPVFVVAEIYDARFPLVERDARGRSVDEQRRRCARMRDLRLIADFIPKEIAPIFARFPLLHGKHAVFIIRTVILHFCTSFFEKKNAPFCSGAFFRS